MGVSVECCHGLAGANVNGLTLGGERQRIASLGASQNYLSSLAPQRREFRLTTEEGL
jgi:hypothetical protein